MMEVEVKLFDVTSLAADGSNIPRRSCEAYLQSQDYQIIIRDKIAIGGLTHKDRKLAPEYKGVVGMDDQVLINDNATHYITGLYFKPGDNFLYARSKTFDPDLFAGKKKENIQNLIGFLQSGVRMPISVVIQALWSKRGTAEKIIRIKGFDYTMNPSFKGAGDLQIFSEIVSEDQVEGEELKAFSESISSGDLMLQTRIYSTTGECIILSEDDTRSFGDSSEESEPTALEIFKSFSKNFITYSDIISRYGRSSEQARLFSSLEGTIITEKEVSDLPDKSGARYKQIIGSLENHINSPQVQDIDNKSLISKAISSSREIPRDEMFSNPTIIASRLLDLDQPRYTKIERILNNYKNYWKPELSDDRKLKLKMMLIQDLQILIKSVADEIYNNRTLDTLYGLGRYGKEVKDSSIELSKTYRKVMVSERVMKFIPKGVQGEWVIDCRNFYQAILLHCFGEGLDEVQLNLLDIKN